MRRHKAVGGDPIARWCELYDAVELEVCRLAFLHWHYIKLRELILSSRVASGPSTFHRWLAMVYSDAAAVAIRRLVGTGKDEASLPMLLQDIRQDAPLLTQARHVELWRNTYGMQSNWDSHLLRCAKGEAKRLFRGRSFLHRESVGEDIGRLAKATEALHLFATRRVAHALWQMPVKPVPVASSLKRAVRVIDDLTHKYGLLLKGSATRPFKDFPANEDWNDIFRAAWLPANAAVGNC
ncbi:MAG TPA: hypothetical protein VGP72_27600 [Planctomycetota bacterium]